MANIEEAQESVICDFCAKALSFFCSTCGQKLCEDCKISHNECQRTKTHIVVRYRDRMNNLKAKVMDEVFLVFHDKKDPSNMEYPNDEIVDDKNAREWFGKVKEHLIQQKTISTDYKRCEQGTSEAALPEHAPPKNQRKLNENEESSNQQTANDNTKTEDASENNWLERVRKTLIEALDTQGTEGNNNQVNDKVNLRCEIDKLILQLSNDYSAVKLENQQYGQKAEEKELLFQRSMTETDIRGQYGTIRGDSKKVVERYKKESEDLRRQVTQLIEEKNYRLKRVSEIAGAKLTDGNAQITDLSDPNRPTELAERFGELYDSTWTNVLEEYTDLAKSTDDVYKREKEAIEGMKAILKDCFNVCKEEVDNIITKTSKALKLKRNEITTEIQQEIKGLRKLASQRTLEVMIKPLSDKVTKHSKIKKMKTVEEFVHSCIDVCWFMVIQEPPLTLDFCEAGKNCPFDSNRFQFYTRSGKIVDFVVWPALLLHDKGPLLRKGVAEPVHEKKKK